MLSENQRRWGVDQWSAFLGGRELPCMRRSKARLAELLELRGDALSARELADIAGTDPFLCLRLLREAENRRVQRLGHDTTTPLAAVMQLGTRNFRRLLENSPEIDEANEGLARCEARAHLASQLAQRWGSARADVSPDEVAMASLLAETGELLLWCFVPELPLAALAALRDGRAQRSVQAQVDICGFRFKDLTLKCAAQWNLPPLLAQLIRGIDNTRANLSRLCVDTARHLLGGGPEDPALPSDIAEAQQLIPAATASWLTAQIPGLDEEAANRLCLLAASASPSAQGIRA